MFIFIYSISMWKNLVFFVSFADDHDKNNKMKKYEFERGRGRGVFFLLLNIDLHCFEPLDLWGCRL